MATLSRGERRRRWPSWSVFGRLSGLRVGTRVVLLLLIPMSALLLVAGVANRQGIERARQLETFQQRAGTDLGVSDIVEAMSQERALSVRARPATPAQAARVREQAERVDRRIADVAQVARSVSDTEDVGGRLDAVHRQLFAIRLRAPTMTAAETQRGYGRAIDNLEAIERDLTGRPPSRDVATAVFADLAMRAAMEAARREQLDFWLLLRGSEQEAGRAAVGGQWAALEQSALNAFRSAAPSDEVADLGAALFGPPGLYVRRIRTQLAAGQLANGSAEAARWWRQSEERLVGLGRVRAASRGAVRATVASDLSAARADVWRTLALSVAVVVAVLALGLLLRRSIARSLDELSRGARALSAGDLDVEISTAGHDEIAAVGEAFGAVRATNRQLVDELVAMNAAIAAKDLTRRADKTTFDGAWANVLEGMNGTMTEVARLHGAADREVERQKAFGIVGRRVVSGIRLQDAYREACQLLVDHVSALRAEVYVHTDVGWHRRVLVGVDAPAWPPDHAFSTGVLESACRPDASFCVVRGVGEVEEEPAAMLVAEFARVEALQPGDVLFVNGVARLLEEASNRRREEETRLRAQKLEVTGTLAASFAHDFNNVLGAILNNARFGELQTRGQEAEETFSAIAGAVDRASEIVNRLLSFARSDPPASDEIDLSALIEEVCALLRPGLPRTIELVCRADDGLSSVVGDPTGIHQIVVNLVTNAAQALGTTTPGRITVTADETALTGDASDRGGVSAGRYARIRVHDTGPGIPEAVAKRVFDPFFTTKPKGEGTGLGLAAALTIAQDHRGTLDIKSVPGGGTTATLCLPIEP